MIYFTVEKEVLRGMPECYDVASDGSQIGVSWEEDEEIEITTGFMVRLYDEDGSLDEGIFYPVNTNAETGENNEDKVLEQIKADYPAGEYQNNGW